jgi:hypothetical protein
LLAHRFWDPSGLMASTLESVRCQKVVIGFYPGQDGSFSQIYDDEGSDEVRIKGQISGDIIDADVTNPPCEHHWHLTKVSKGR